MSTTPKLYKVCLLISTVSWEQVKKVFRDELGITKDKKDDSVVPIRDHYVVGAELPETELSDDFYAKVAKSKSITILSDESSQERARSALTHIASVELKLRELAVYAYDLAATYREIMNIKHKDAKPLVSKNKLVDENLADPLVAFFDFGEIIDFLDKTGNLVEETNLADDTARLMESCVSFDEFKKKYAQKFKKLTVWEIISDAVLVSNTQWSDVKKDLLVLKDIRNTALHHRVLSPGKFEEARTTSERLMKQFTTKVPKAKTVQSMDTTFDSWNKALTGYDSYKKAIERMVNLQASNGFQKIISQQLNAEKSFQRAIENMTRMPDLQVSAFDSLRSSIESINQLGLSTWVNEEYSKPESSTPKDVVDQTDEQKGDLEDQDETEQNEGQK